MLLEPQDAGLFFKLHRALMFFAVDVRDSPREVQAVAFSKGLIPYIPADRQRGE